MVIRVCDVKGWLALVVILVGLAVAAPALAVEAGQPPPDFTLADLDGKEVRLSDFKGKPIVLKLATTWCPSCKQQVKELAGIAGFLTANGIVLIEVYVDEPEEAVREYLQQREFNVPHVALLDDGQVARSYRLYTIPRVLLIDPDFKVTRDRGLIAGNDLQKALEPMLR